MTNINPATPAQAATPGNAPQVPATPSAGTPPVTNQGTQGTQQDGTVVISAKEYRELQRDHARVVSFEQRAAFVKKNPPVSQSISGNEGNDPELINALAKKDQELVEAKQQSLKNEIALKVRDILEKPEYTALPSSTKALILKNPHMLSSADNLDEALLDIEDFIREQVLAPGSLPASQPVNNNIPVHQTPSVVNSPSPAPAPAADEIDTSKLSGPAKSQAMIKNKIKSLKRGQL